MMTASLALGDRVSVAWSPPGTTEHIETTGIVIARVACPVAFRRESPPPAYDVLTADHRILPGVAATALTRLFPGPSPVTEEIEA